jgi:hypothetical protein
LHPTARSSPDQPKVAQRPSPRQGQRRGYPRAAGSPLGIGLGMKPEPNFLKAGDAVTLGIDGLGVQRQKVVKGKQ